MGLRLEISRCISCICFSDSAYTISLSTELLT